MLSPLRLPTRPRQPRPSVPRESAHCRRRVERGVWHRRHTCCSPRHGVHRGRRGTRRVPWSSDRLRAQWQPGRRRSDRRGRHLNPCCRDRAEPAPQGGQRHRYPLRRRVCPWDCHHQSCPGYAGSLQQFLFGSITGIPDGDVVTVLGGGAAIVVVLLLLNKELVAVGSTVSLPAPSGSGSSRSTWCSTCSSPSPSYCPCRRSATSSFWRSWSPRRQQPDY